MALQRATNGLHAIAGLVRGAGVVRDYLNPPAIYGEPARRMLSRQELVALMRQALAEMETVNAVLDGVIAQLKADAQRYLDAIVRPKPEEQMPEGTIQ